MKCERHPRIDAVASCANCGTSVCRSCAEISKELRDELGILCLDCYRRSIETATAFAESTVKRKIILLICKIVCYLIGILLIVFSPAGSGQFILGFVLCGVFEAVVGWKEGKRAHEKHEERHGVTYYITDNGIERDTGLSDKIIHAVSFCILGIIATPVTSFTDLFEILRLRSDRDVFAEELERLNKLDNSDPMADLLPHIDDEERRDEDEKEIDAGSSFNTKTVEQAPPARSSTPEANLAPTVAPQPKSGRGLLIAAVILDACQAFLVILSFIIKPDEGAGAYQNGGTVIAYWILAAGLLVASIIKAKRAGARSVFKAAVIALAVSVLIPIALFVSTML